MERSQAEAEAAKRLLSQDPARRVEREEETKKRALEERARVEAERAGGSR
jgi:hypothetical protein